MFAVPNHMLGQFSSELLTLYPTANILVAGKEDFEASKRARLFSRIATGNWDAVIVTHSSFEKIPVSVETRRSFHRRADSRNRTSDPGAEGRARHAAREGTGESEDDGWKQSCETLSADHKKDNTLTFEELGIDRLFIDEAHKFKNLFYVTKMTRVAGLPQTASERAFDLFLKVQHIQEKNKGGGVVFATGTPISNTMAEMFTMQRYLQMSTLRRNQLQHFDSWAGTFGETVTAMELSPDGAGYRLQSRFARFVNVPELMQQFRQVADVQTAEMLKLPVPKMEQGRPITVSAPTTPELKRFVDQLVEASREDQERQGRSARRQHAQDHDRRPQSRARSPACPSARPRQPGLQAQSGRGKDSPGLARLHADRKARSSSSATCPRPKPAAEGSPSMTTCATSFSRAASRTRKSHSFRTATTTPRKPRSSRDVREGKVRVLFGSTPKMGEGTNVQKRLVALHHLDAPWRPADIEQRDGRILRQGNQNEYVKIFRYVTEGSFDAYMWQTLETKCRFIAQVMNGDATVRRAEDVDAAALTYAEVKAIASGNPLVIEKAHVDAEVMRLTRLKKQHAESQYQMRYRIKTLGRQRADRASATSPTSAKTCARARAHAATTSR